MRRFSGLIFSFVVGCSGSTFEVANELPDGSTEAATDSELPDAVVPETCATPNSCGGCAKLDHALGDACGTCKVGVWKCDGNDTLRCEDPFTGALPDTACGTCKTVKLACAPDGKSAICPTDDANACGGCGAIANYPGTKCGTCKTLEFKCTVDKAGTFCPGDDHNGCMGCTTLTNAPGKVCGVCAGGSYKCSGTEATLCADPVTTPAPGTTCGICMKSSYACVGGTSTACTRPDDRVDGADTFYSSYGSSIWTLSGADGPSSTIAIAFTTARVGAITSLGLGLQRYEANGTYPLPGTVRVQLIKGNPTLTPAPADILATTSLTGDAIADVPSIVNVAISSAPSLPAGTRLWVKVTDISDRYNYGALGGSATGPTHLSLWYVGTSAWEEYTSSDPYLRVGMLGCF